MTTNCCSITGKPFTISDFELELRRRFGFNDLPTISVPLRFRELGAFWPHWNLHARTCSKTGKRIISIFREDCIFPVWDREEWVKEANPPQAEVDFNSDFFSQAFKLFQKCPLPHTFQIYNENCEYTDDFYKSKNCYLSHSSNFLEDCRYCYYGSKARNIQFGVLFGSSELCSDIVNSQSCYQVVYGIDCQEVRDSAFVYDCRNCAHCMFCTNLRNRSYCFDNHQLSESEYKKKVEAWNLKSRATFQRAKEKFLKMLITQAWHRATCVDRCEDCSGNFLSNSKNCEDCYITLYHEDCVHDAISGPNSRTTLDSMGTIGSELLFYTVMCVHSYEVRFSFEVNECRFCDYCMYCLQCKNCFACAGLVGKEYCIFNKQYSVEEYKIVREKLIQHMQATAEWGKFFPGCFAPNPYDESCSGYFFPLKNNEQQEFGFRTTPSREKRSGNYRSPHEIPDAVQDLTTQELELLTKQVFWDEAAQRPFQITHIDIENSVKLQVPLPYCFYIQRVQDNFRYLPFQGELRQTTCAHSGAKVLTGWPKEFDGRILSEEAYLNTI